MTPEQRLKRAERILGMLARAGRRAREEWRKESHTQDEKINILINTQIRNERVWHLKSELINEQIRATNEQMRATDEQIKALAVAQAELTQSQKRTDQALRAFINSLRKSGNGKLST